MTLLNNKLTKIGNVEWTREEIKEAIPEFLQLYHSKPIKDNVLGMRSPHMFATWFLLKKLNPTTVIESGIWKGQGTWLIEKTLPNAKIYSIDIELKKREYISNKVSYFENDFSLLDWSIVTDKENTVVFFDDHQNAFSRIEQAKKVGFKKLIFEDNYPYQVGDCYSLKKIFQHAGFKPVITNKGKGLRRRIREFFNPLPPPITILPNQEDAFYLQQNLSTYYEFPPVFKSQKTRWKDDWNEEYPTSLPLYETKEQNYLSVFEEEAMQYTWICLAILKG